MSDAQPPSRTLPLAGGGDGASAARAVLAFDTSGPWCAAALGEVVLAEPMERGQAERLMPLLAEVMAAAGLGWGDLSGIACGTGPGNFTGVRVAVAAARGLALASGLRAVGVSRFDAVAWVFPQRPLVVALDARRGEAYAQVFGDQTAAPALVTEADRARYSDLPMAGDARWPGERLGDLGPEALVRAIACVGAQRLAEGASPPAPLYLRPADAAPPRDPAPVLLP